MTSPQRTALLAMLDQNLAEADARLNRFIETYRAGTEMFTETENVGAMALALLMLSRGNCIELLVVAVRRLAQQDTPGDVGGGS